MENASKAIQSLLGLTGLLYVLGFLTFNSHLASYGIIDLEVISLNYLKAGVLVLIIAVPSIYYTVNLYRAGGFNADHKKMGLTGYYALALQLFIVVFLCDYSHISNKIITYIFLFFTIVFMFLSLEFFFFKKNQLIISFFTAIFLSIILLARGEITTASINTISIVLIGVVSLLVTLESKGNEVLGILNILVTLTLCASFGFKGYKGISHMYGGGKPYIKSVVLTSEDSLFFSRDTTLLSGDTIFSSKVPTIYEDEKQLYASPEKGVIITISKNHIYRDIYKKENKLDYK